MSSRQTIRTVALGLALAAGLAAAAGCAYKGPKTTSESGGVTLVDTYWRLARVDGIQIVASTDRKEAHLILRPDNRVTGFGSCNTFNGSWLKEDGKLSLGPLVSTMMACPDLAIEQKMLGALDGDVLAEVEGTTLRVTGADGTELVFEARDFE